MRKELRLTKTVSNTDDFRDLEHFITAKGGQVTEVTALQTRQGLSVSYILPINKK